MNTQVSRFARVASAWKRWVCQSNTEKGEIHYQYYHRNIPTYLCVICLAVVISHFSYAPHHSIYLELNPTFRTSYCLSQPLQTDFRAFFFFPWDFRPILLFTRNWPLIWCRTNLSQLFLGIFLRRYFQLTNTPIGLWQLCKICMACQETNQSIFKSHFYFNLEIERNQHPVNHCLCEEVTADFQTHNRP